MTIESNSIVSITDSHEGSTERIVVESTKAKKLKDDTIYYIRGWLLDWEGNPYRPVVKKVRESSAGVEWWVE